MTVLLWFIPAVLAGLLFLWSLWQWAYALGRRDAFRESLANFDRVFGDIE